MSVESLNMCDAIADECRCSMCKEYLSCSPIRVLPDGKKICGRCTPTNPDVSTSRDSVLENVLNLISFPCRFRKEGCSERSLFGQVIAHEIKCNYRITSCFATECTWQGTASTLFDHIMKEHNQLVKEKAEIKLQLAVDTEGIFIVVEGPVIFAIRYLYNYNNQNFKYDIAYYAIDNKYDTFFKITLMNSSDSACAINLKPIKCQAFDGNFYDLQNQIVFNLKKFCETLDNPDSVVIVFNLTVTQVNSTNQTLDVFRCGVCCNYLIPPLFEFDTKVVCYECGENNNDYTPSNNKQLLQLLKQIDFPCRWRNCSFSGKYDVYKTHQTSCKFYLHECFDCPDTFTVLNAIDHYTDFHDAEYFVGKLVHTISFSREFEWIRKHTIKTDVYILFDYKMATEGKAHYATYTLELQSTSPGGITASVNFEHQHCTRKPKPFKLTSEEELNITLDQLPSCYKKDEELTVTISIQ